MQSQFMTMMSLSKGCSILAETVFESRCGHVSALREMGADIISSHNNTTFLIHGVEQLRAAKTNATDLRAGAALILAGLAAEGTSVITDIHHIQRGYEDIAKDLRQLGADIHYSNLHFKQ